MSGAVEIFVNDSEEEGGMTSGTKLLLIVFSPAAAAANRELTEICFNFVPPEFAAALDAEDDKEVGLSEEDEKELEEEEDGRPSWFLSRPLELSSDSEALDPEPCSMG